MPATRNDCPLCGTIKPAAFAKYRDHDYLHCNRCDLVFVPGDQHLPTDLEYARYQQHQNRPDDPRYRAFLDRLLRPLLVHLKPGAEGLDFGSGPGPTLSVMLMEHGFKMSIYDPFFAPSPDTLRRTYDFVTCTETVEHFANPAAEFERINGLLRSGGHLGVMTQLRTPTTDFNNWHYIRDDTHIGFYSETTMRWIGQHWNWQVDFPAPTIAIFRKAVSLSS